MPLFRRLRKEPEFVPAKASKITLSLPKFQGTAVHTAGILDILRQKIEYGTAQSNEIGWYRVNFRTPFSSPPSVVCTPLNREGWYSKETYSAPRFDISSPSMPTLNIEELRQDVSEWCTQAYVDARVSFMYSNVDKMCEGVDRLPGIGSMMCSFWRWVANQIRPLVESLARYESQILADVFSNVIARVMSKVTDTWTGLYNRTSDLYEKNMQGYQSLAKLSEKSLNESVDHLYSMIGMPQGALITVVPTRNICRNSFEFLGQKNTKISWIAIGDR